MAYFDAPDNDYAVCINRQRQTALFCIRDLGVLALIRPSPGLSISYALSPCPKRVVSSASLGTSGGCSCSGVLARTSLGRRGLSSSRSKNGDPSEVAKKVFVSATIFMPGIVLRNLACNNPKDAALPVSPSGRLLHTSYSEAGLLAASYLMSTAPRKSDRVNWQSRRPISLPPCSSTVFHLNWQGHKWRNR